MQPHPDPDEAVSRQVEGELRLLRGAILLVASRRAPRIDVANLRLAAAVLPEANRLAAAEGVRLVPLWNADETLSDIRVEPIRP
jgi:hypothetical protein